ncbi:MAG: hypothetical protein LPJ89_00825 [Hymenobacteraceae bacterium]|nr:hypothetical protein [Hymenobacteraceae bacterium]MDX5395147.1 hypothetical protein [Hymenobacteraceae bacterium]MDX5442309.1 hypothetical protein [Hymenobacteraceae bacterium]MDX5511188.1 hypothetical protein [Hymenobacteraceae bacterium]
MKKNILLYTLLFLLFSAPVLQAQTSSDSDSHASDTERKWYIPDHAVVQFAGNIGIVSGGVGYSYLKDKMQSDLMYGMAPGFEDASTIHIVTLKTAYHPFNLALNEKYRVEPLRVGLGISYTMGSQFYTKWPSRYPDGYYTWSTSYRFTPFLGSSISRKIGNQDKAIKMVQLYGEVGSHDLDLASYVRDSWVSAWDIINFALGTKIVF